MRNSPVDDTRTTAIKARELLRQFWFIIDSTDLFPGSGMHL